MLPLDLHVLSLSLAFILSQDQTLRCSNCFMSLLKIPLFFQVQVFLTVFILNTCTTVVYVNFSKNSSQSFLAKRGAKVRIFIFIFQIFSKFFFDLFFRKFFRDGFRTFAWIFQPHPSVYLFPDPLTPLSSCHHRISLDCGYKSTRCKTYFPNIFTTFLQLFFTLLDCQWFTNALFSPLLLSSPFFISPFEILNFQSYILNSQKAGVFLPIRAGFPAKDAGFFFFLYLPFQIK